jgi:hypothetical protein
VDVRARHFKCSRTSRPDQRRRYGMMPTDFRVPRLMFCLALIYAPAKAYEVDDMKSRSREKKDVNFQFTKAHGQGRSTVPTDPRGLSKRRKILFRKQDHY